MRIHHDARPRALAARHAVNLHHVRGDETHGDAVIAMMELDAACVGVIELERR